MNKQNGNKLIGKEHFDGCQMGGRGVGGMGKTQERIKKYRLVVTKELWGCKVQQREYSH